MYRSLVLTLSLSLSLSLPPTPSECSVEGQEYYDGVNTCVPCTGTCKEPIIACTLECRSGCGCPVGTVLDEEANVCVNETDCPKRETCGHVTITWPESNCIMTL